MNARSLLLALLLAAAAILPAAAQPAPAWNPGSRVQLTRADLEGMLAEYDRAAASRTGSAAFRARTAAEAEAVRARLRDGDLQVGDQVAVFVESQPAMSDTFVVRAGRVLFLPAVGDVPVGGLLRSEVEARVQEYVARVVRDPVVRAQPLVRLVVEGEVGAPGYYLVPADVPVSDVLMTAGGVTTRAALARVRIERGGTPVWQGQPLQEAVARGRTVDAMNLHPGDRLFVPGPQRTAGSVLRAVPVGVTVLYGIMRLFGG